MWYIFLDKVKWITEAIITNIDSENWTAFSEHIHTPNI